MNKGMYLDYTVHSGILQQREDRRQIRPDGEK